MPCLRMVLRNSQRALRPSSARLVALTLATTVSFAPAEAAERPPQYAAGISVQPDVGYLDDGSPLRIGYPLFGDSPKVSPNSVDLSFAHISYLRSASTGTAYAGPENGGIVRAIARTGDELIGAEAGLNYTFQLKPKAGAVLPDVVPLHVFAQGSTGSENYAGARITFILSWADSATTGRDIFKDTGVASNPYGISTWGGNGKIDIDEDITVALNRDILVQMRATASAGIPVSDQNPNQDEYGTGSAYLDPVFTLPAEFRNLVDIVGVPTALIPEPPSWALMFCGFGVIARAMLRRRELSRRHT
jgi:hypothetical protein